MGVFLLRTLLCQILSSQLVLNCLDFKSQVNCTSKGKETNTVRGYTKERAVHINDLKYAQAAEENK